MTEKMIVKQDSQIFFDIARIIETNEFLAKKAKKGMCRVWCSDAVKILLDNQEINQFVKLEIREVQIEQGLFHTFLRVIIDKNYFILDGTGVGNYDPYFGLESNASHLQNSHFDMLHFIILDVK